eukprot:scaffold11478_cov70-Cylindrotheca_fusiformis.AAC.2
MDLYDLGKPKKQSAHRSSIVVVVLLLEPDHYYYFSDEDNLDTRMNHNIDDVDCAFVPSTTGNMRGSKES